jgi:hypothetical protein
MQSRGVLWLPEGRKPSTPFLSEVRPLEGLTQVMVGLTVGKDMDCPSKEIEILIEHSYDAGFTFNEWSGSKAVGKPKWDNPCVFYGELVGVSLMGYGAFHAKLGYPTHYRVKIIPSEALDWGLEVFEWR